MRQIPGLATGAVAAGQVFFVLYLMLPSLALAGSSRRPLYLVLRGPARAFLSPGFQVKFILSTQIHNSPPLVPGASSLRRRQNLNHPFLSPGFLFLKIAD